MRKAILEAFASRRHPPVRLEPDVCLWHFSDIERRGSWTYATLRGWDLWRCACRESGLGTKRTQ
jgi:hypothetical protein